MRKSFFIVNPESGSKQGRKLKREIEFLWNQNRISFEIYVTKNHMDIAMATHRAMEVNATEIIVVGGDGTLLAVASALTNKLIPIGIVPCGTGNDFARTHHLPLHAEASLMNLLKWSATKAVDIGNINNSYFLNVASIGIDAAIVKRTQKIRKIIKGPFAYFISSLIEIVCYEPIRIELSIDEIDHEYTVELVAVANGCCYGGGMKIAPMADPTDGVYDVIIAKNMKWIRLIQLLPKLYTGGHIGEPEVEIYQGKNILIRTANATSINCDGELSEGDFLQITEINNKIIVIDI